MSALQLKYDANADRLQASAASGARRDSSGLAGQGRPVHGPGTKAVVSFEVADFKHFVSYYLLDELFGDQVVRQIASFQSAATASLRRSEEIKIPKLPHSSRRVIKELLRAA